MYANKKSFEKLSFLKQGWEDLCNKWELLLCAVTATLDPILINVGGVINIRRCLNLLIGLG